MSDHLVSNRFQNSLIASLLTSTVDCAVSDGTEAKVSRSSLQKASDHLSAITMVSHRLIPIGAMSTIKHAFAHDLTNHTRTITDDKLELSTTYQTSKASGPLDTALPVTINPVQATTSTEQRKPKHKHTAGKLGLGPSGAIVFRNHRSLESLASTNTTFTGTVSSLADFAIKLTNDRYDKRPRRTSKLGVFCQFSIADSIKGSVGFAIHLHR